MTSNPGDMFDNFFGQNSPFGPGYRPSAKKPEKGVPWQAKIIDGKYYVPLEQVAELLKENDVLPAVRKGIENRVEMQREAAKTDFKPMRFDEVETGLCSGQTGNLHPLCIVSNTPHDMHTVEVKHS